MINNIFNKLKHLNDKMSFDMKISIIVLVLVIIIGIVEGALLLKNHYSKNNNSESNILSNKHSNSLVNNNNSTNNQIANITESPSSTTTSEQQKSKKIPMLIQYYYGTCDQCIASRAILEEVKTENSDKLEVKFVNMNTERKNYPNINIKGFPTLIIYDSQGKEILRRLGAILYRDQIDQMLDELEIVKLESPILDGDADLTD